MFHHTRFGNIQKYLIHHRNKFINQVDPNTGIINFDIGRDLLRVSSAGEEIDWPTQRERGEASAHYLATTSQTGEEAAAAGGYLGKRALTAPDFIVFPGSHGVGPGGREERGEGEECEVHQGALPAG